MHSGETFFMSPVGVLALAFFGLLLLGGLALFIYSLVIKRYWLTTLMLILPIGLVAVLFFLPVGLLPIKMNARRLEMGAVQDSGVTTTAGDSDLHVPDGVWENNPTADVYPSVALCGRPLAYQVATAVRSEKRKSKKFAVTFVKEKHPGDRDQWKPPQDFCVNFGNEFVKQFPGSVVVFPAEREVKIAEADTTDKKLMPLEIKLSLRPEDKSKAASTGEISARWTTPKDNRAVVSINFADKPWLVDIDKYAAKKKLQHYTLVDSPRSARSPTEATAMALEAASQNVPIAPNQIADRFAQKLTLPYGELYREAILVDHNIPRSSVGLTNYPDADTLVEGRRSREQGASVGLNPTRGLILTTIGLIAIGWISNLLTQGYYRQNISYIVVTGVIVMLGLLGLAFMMVQI